MSAAASKPPPSQPDEQKFKAFVTRLLRVPKAEVDARERGRVRRRRQPKDDKVSDT